MNAESIVVSLDMAKQLAKAGWPQEESYLAWFTMQNGKTSEVHRNVGNLLPIDFAAPTAEEILRRLPGYVLDKGITYGLRVEKLNPLQIFDRTGENQEYMWKMDYYRIRDNIELCPPSPPVTGTNLANAAAAMWCYLSENDLL